MVTSKGWMEFEVQGPCAVPDKVKRLVLQLQCVCIWMGRDECNVLCVELKKRNLIKEV